MFCFDDADVHTGQALLPSTLGPGRLCTRDTQNRCRDAMIAERTLAATTAVIAIATVWSTQHQDSRRVTLYPRWWHARAIAQKVRHNCTGLLPLKTSLASGKSSSGTCEVAACIERLLNRYEHGVIARGPCQVGILNVWTGAASTCGASRSVTAHSISV